MLLLYYCEGGGAPSLCFPSIYFSFLVLFTMSSKDSSIDLLSFHRGPNMISTILGKDDIRWIWCAYYISSKIALEIPSPVEKVIVTQENRIAIYE